MIGPWARPTAEQVVQAHGPQVYAHLRRIFGPQADVDDLFQQVFVEVLRSLPRFQGRSKVRTWIHRITWNVAYQEMRLRYQRPQPVALEPEHGVAPAFVEDEVDRRRSVEELYVALEALPPKLRRVVVEHDIEGRTLREIADELGQPLQTVASRMKAGRTELAKTLRRRVALGPRLGRVSGQ